MNSLTKDLNPSPNTECPAHIAGITSMLLEKLNGSVAAWPAPIIDRRPMRNPVESLTCTGPPAIFCSRTITLHTAASGKVSGKTARRWSPSSSRCACAWLRISIRPFASRVALRPDTARNLG
jgi:hypothetical protein